MHNLRKAKEKLKEHQEAQEHLVSQSQNILRGQADVLCQALQQLKRRSDAGQKTAELIWNRLIDGITAEIPDKFFYKHARNYFWGVSEELSNDELAFRKLLEQVASKKKNTKGYEKGPSAREIVSTAPTREVVSTASSSSSSKNICTGEIKEEEENDDGESDELLGHLVAILKVAAAITNPTMWEWRKEDVTLRQEVRMFNDSLKGAMDLFAEIHNSPDLSSLIESLEKVSLVKKRRNTLMRLETSLQQKLNEKQLEISDDGEVFTENDGEVFDESETEEDFDFSKCKAVDLTINKTKRALTTVANQEENASKLETLSCDSISGDVHASKLDTDGEEYIVRHARSKLAGQPLTESVFGNGKCDHAGYKVNASHYRDWRRDGFRCMCGQKFRLLNSMERHIFAQQMVRMLNCDQCDYKVNRRCCMERHKIDNHNKPKMLRACRRLYQCMFGCEGVLKSKAELLDHHRMTDRQCKHRNAMKLPVRRIPSTPLGFLEVLKNTFERADLLLTKELLGQILRAAGKDASRLKNAKNERVGVNATTEGT